MGLSSSQFQGSIYWLQQNSGLILPYGKFPGSYPGGNLNVGETEIIWNAYQWNPPQYFVEYTDPDPNASTKPTYEELLNAGIQAEFESLKDKLPRRLKIFCRNFIAERAYGSRNSDWKEDEFYVRSRLLEAGDVASLAMLKRMNDHRDHIRWRYHEIKHAISHLEVTQGNLESLRLIADIISSSYSDSAQSDPLFSGPTFTFPGMTEPFSDYDNVPEYVNRVPENPPPFNITIERERKDGSRHFFRVKTTAKAEISLSTDQPGFVSGMPSQLTLKRAGSSAFESSISRFAPTLTIKASAAPYGETVESSFQIQSTNQHDYLAVPSYDQYSATIEWPDLSILITDAITQTRAYLRSLWLNDQGTVAMRLSSTTSQEDSWDAGPSFITSWLDNGSISLMNENGDELILTAPNAIGNTMQDSTEPYLWTVRNLTEVQAFIATFSTRPRQAAGIRFIVQ